MIKWVVNHDKFSSNMLDYGMELLTSVKMRHVCEYCADDSARYN